MHLVSGRSSQPPISETSRQAKSHADDVAAGVHAIEYREHVWFLHERGLSDEEIEALLKRESYRPGRDRDLANAYDGDARGGGPKAEIGSVAEILGRPERRAQRSADTSS